MAVDVTFDPIAPNSANPEVAANTALDKFAAAITEIDASATGIPPGGTTGQFLAKQSATDGDADWETIVIPEPGGGGAEYPPGGTTGQYLGKASNADNDVAWFDLPEGGGGGPGGGSFPIGGAHIYWRVLVTDLTGPRTDFANCTELEFRATIGGEPQAISGPIASGSFEAGANGPNRAFDGIKTGNNYWVSQNGNLASGNIWIGAQFALPVRVGQVYLAQGTISPEISIKSFILQWSDDAITWTTVQGFTTTFTDTSTNVEYLADVDIETIAYITEAPIDGQMYVRKDGAWVVLPA